MHNDLYHVTDSLNLITTLKEKKLLVFKIPSLTVGHSPRAAVINTSHITPIHQVY